MEVSSRYPSDVFYLSFTSLDTCGLGGADESNRISGRSPGVQSVDRSTYGVVVEGPCRCRVGDLRLIVMFGMGGRLFIYRDGRFRGPATGAEQSRWGTWKFSRIRIFRRG